VSGHVFVCLGVSILPLSTIFQLDVKLFRRCDIFVLYIVSDMLTLSVHDESYSSFYQISSLKA